MFDPSAITEDIMRDIVRDTELEQKLLMVSGHTIVDIINGHFVKKPA
jgi:Na+/proline symporter